MTSTTHSRRTLQRTSSQTVTLRLPHRRTLMACKWYLAVMQPNTGWKLASAWSVPGSVGHQVSAGRLAPWSEASMRQMASNSWSEATIIHFAGGQKL